MKLLNMLGLLALMIAAPTISSAQAMGNCIVFDESANFSDPGYDSNCEPLGQAGVADSTEAYIGLTWKFGSGLDQPLFAIGVRTVGSDGGDDLRGADLRASFDVKDRFALNSVKLGYLAGKPEAILNFGGGYSFKDSEAIASASISRGAAELGVEYGVKSRKATPFVSLTSLAEPKTGSACRNGFTEESLNGIVVFTLGDDLGIPNGAESLCIDRGDLIYFTP